ncbi:phosphatase PAP2 family protein [Methylovorus mays]|uniref:phosphatase PAP2 family protein n=1 Tax=Methylovorus mays TaxID=184077 RepID=UPI001E47DFAD|nr:phosphatase PAP2 family protein [Methylovorus mays]MCB5207743.1 phosphatase PAP2 family protein [Methylovorus mays]
MRDMKLTLVVLVSSLLAIFYVDAPVALWIKANFLSYAPFREYTSNLPSHLFWVVLAGSTISFSCYFYLRWLGEHSPRRNFFLLLGVVLPVAFIAKNILKLAFARIEVRLWLSSPEGFQPHWFQMGKSGYDSFPSGHMVVFMTIFMAFWQFYPRWRSGYFIGASLLAAALVATNYHYVSDVIAGTYIGILVYWATRLVVLREGKRGESWHR